MAAEGKKRKSWLKKGVGAAGLIPAIVIGFRFFTDRLGANPIEAALNQLGFWTLVTLLASLACTPLKILFDWNWPLRIRRMLGLMAFFYGCLHFLMYFVVDQFFDFATILEDITKRKFITVGFLALILMVPLAVTSTNKMVKRLGFPLWKQLHRVAYLIGVLGIVHFVWRVKADLLEPLIYAGILALLFAIRVFAWIRDRRVRPAPSSP